MSGFFTENYEAMRKFSDSIEKFSPANDGELELVRLVKAAIKAVTFNREEYDYLTPYVSARQGRALLEVMGNPLEEDVLRRALMLLACFIREATLVRESRSDSEQVVLDHFLGVANQGDDWEGYHEDFLKTVLPNKLFENNFKSIDRATSDSKKLVQETADKADELVARIEGYRAELKKLDSEYNFVGLSHAFKELLTQKSSEASRSFYVTVFLGAVAVAMPALYLIGVSANLLPGLVGGDWAVSAVAQLLAVVGIELILLYFFRIALKSYLLARSQVTNLQLRVSLCSFIEGYLDFGAKAQASKAAAAIQGFESLIFSTLPSDDPTLPATLDGLDQITNLVRAIRS